MQLFMNIIEYLFSSKKTLIFTAVEQQDYYKVISLLDSNNMKHRASITTSTSATPGSPYSNLAKVYKIYVKKDDKDKALKTIKSNRN